MSQSSTGAKTSLWDEKRSLTPSDRRFLRGELRLCNGRENLSRRSRRSNLAKPTTKWTTNVKNKKSQSTLIKKKWNICKISDLLRIKSSKLKSRPRSRGQKLTEKRSTWQKRSTRIKLKLVTSKLRKSSLSRLGPTSNLKVKPRNVTLSSNCLRWLSRCAKLARRKHFFRKRNKNLKRNIRKFNKRMSICMKRRTSIVRIKSHSTRKPWPSKNKVKTTDLSLSR